jgi:hypothetical protein
MCADREDDAIPSGLYLIRQASNRHRHIAQMLALALASGPSSAVSRLPKLSMVPFCAEA